MFEKFDASARESLRLADLFARHCRHHTIDTTHLLYGIASAAAQGRAPVARTVLTDPQLVRDTILSGVTDSDGPSRGHLPFTGNMKQALDYALRSSMMLGDSHISDGHLLAGLARATDSTGARILAELGITEDTIRSATQDSTEGPSPTAARTFTVYVPAGKSVFKNGGRIYIDLATAQEAHPGQDIAPFPLRLTDGEFFDVGAALPENRFKSWGSYTDYADAFAAAEQFRKNASGYEIGIRIMTPTTVEHRGRDAGGRDVILGRTVAYDRVRVTSRVMDSSADTEGARIV